MTSYLAVLLLAAAGGRDPAFEQGLRDQYERVEPGLGDQLVAATKALDEGKLDEAAQGFEALTKKAPQVSGAFRRLSAVRAEQGRGDEAVSLAEFAQNLEPGIPNDLGLMRALMRRHQSDDDRRAERISNAVLSRAPQGGDEWIAAKAAACQFAFAANRLEEGAQCGEALLQYEPELPGANYYGVFAALQREDFSLARERLEKARPVLNDGQHAELLKLMDENEPWTSKWGPLMAEVGAGWAGSFALMAVLGLALSALTLRAARKLATERDLHGSGGAKSLRSVYRGVIGFGSVFYYLSLPIIAVVVIGVFGGVVYLCFAVGRIPIKLVILAVVVGGASIIALIKSLFVRSSDEDPGLQLDFAKAPRLKALIDSVAEKVGTRTVDTVFITPGTDLAVFERGPLLKRLRGHGERCLIIGRGVLDGFERRGFQSVLAHEFGHFSNKDTAGGGVALVARRSLMRMGIALAQSGAAGWYNPAWLFFRAYYAVFLRISQGASRLQEVLADRVSIFTYGSAAFASGYRHVITQSVRFDSHVNRTLDEVVKANRPLANLYRFTPQAAEPGADIEKAVQEALDRPAEPYDSHPSSSDRLSWAATLNVQHPPLADERELVLTLFDDLEGLEKEMTERVRLAVAMNHDLVIKGEEPAADAQTEA